jgi:ADP-heptose:LPS heptosyltransferase
VLQLGRARDVHVRNSYSLRGLTTPRQAIALLRRVSLLVTSDNFLMHAAHLTGTPAVVLWGPTDRRSYGYPEHSHLEFPRACGLLPGDDCIGPERNDGGAVYGTRCPHGDQHCMDQLEPEVVYQEARRAMRYSV